MHITNLFCDKQTCLLITALILYVCIDSSLLTITLRKGHHFIKSMVNGYQIGKQMSTSTTEHTSFNEFVTKMTVLFYEVPLTKIQEISKKGDLLKVWAKAAESPMLAWDIFDLVWLVADKLRSFPILGSMISYEYIYNSPRSFPCML